MTKPHSKAERSITVASRLPAEQLVELCKEAAQQSKIRLDHTEPSRLVMSVRGMVFSSKNCLLEFEVRLASNGSEQIATTQILHYRTTQPTFLFIPVGRQHMVGYTVYEQFIRRLHALTEHTDPQATVTVTG